MVDLGQRRHRALAAAAAGALLDRHRRRDAVDRVHVGPRRGLHELARIGVQRLEIAALAFVEQDVEASVDLPEPETPVITVKRVARDLDVDVACRLCSRALWMTDARSRWRRRTSRRLPAGRRPRRAADASRPARARQRRSYSRAPGRCARRACASRRPACRRRRLAAGVAASGPRSMIQSAARITSRLCSITTQRMAGREQLAERAQQLARRRRSAGRWSARRTGTAVPPVGRAASGRCDGGLPAALGKKAGELQALRLAARQRRHRLAELHVSRPTSTSGCSTRSDLAVAGEERERLGDGHVEHVGDVARAAIVALDRDFEDLRRDSACRRSPGSAGTRRTGTASRRARSHCRRRSGSGRCRS